MPAQHKLITICFSHYVERAKWALDRFGVSYAERPHMPVFHLVPVWFEHRGRAGRADKASSRLSTPVLVTPEGKIFADSRDILNYVDQRYAPPHRRLYDNTSLDAQEKKWHDGLATQSRRLAYAACFRSPGTLGAIARHNVGWIESLLFHCALPVVPIMLRRILGINDASVPRAYDICRRELDEAAALLADGRPYFGGDHFTGYDLSFACFAAALVLPPEYSAWLPKLESFDTDTQTMLDEMQAHPAGQHAAKVFRLHRQERVCAHDQPAKDCVANS